MCTHQYRIINRYTNKELYVKCGKCPACLQEKASYRVSRIKAQDSSDLVTLLVTLTYRRYDCPYVLRDDAYKFAHGDILKLPVYRDYSHRKVRQTSTYDIGYKHTRETVKLCDIDFVDKVDFKNLKDLAYLKGKIGIAYYPDVQRFIARLRLNLKRNYDYKEPIKTFCVSEYGTKSQRPHFHLLLWCRKGDTEILRDAIASSWPFSDIQSFPKSCEESYRASSYVASYVNCGSDFPVFLKKYAKPKHSYSKDFGCNNPLFSVASVLQRFERGHLSFYRTTLCEGIPKIIECVIPKYIIHRYFPLFKGYTRLSPSSALSCMLRIYCDEKSLDSRLSHTDWYESDCVDYRRFLDLISFPVYYSFSDIYKISVRLRNAFIRFNDLSGKNFTFEEYCKLHLRVWSLWKSDCLRLYLQNDDIPVKEKYDNLDDVLARYESGQPLPVGFKPDMLRVTNPNKFGSVITRTQQMFDSYYVHLKHRNVSNMVLSFSNEEF